MALVLIILKSSSGTPVTLVMGAESAIFPFTWWAGGRERDFISERKIYKQIFYIYIFNFLLRKHSNIALPFELLLQSPLLLLKERIYRY